MSLLPEACLKTKYALISRIFFSHSSKESKCFPDPHVNSWYSCSYTSYKLSSRHHKCQKITFKVTLKNYHSYMLKPVPPYHVPKQYYDMLKMFSSSKNPTDNSMNFRFNFLYTSNNYNVYGFYSQLLK